MSAAVIYVGAAAVAAVVGAALVWRATRELHPAESSVDAEGWVEPSNVHVLDEFEEARLRERAGRAR